MARVFLLNPPTAETVRTPLLAFAYLAASLERAGHAVALLDASAPQAPKSPEEIERRIAAFAPDLVGMHLKTLYVQAAYPLAKRLSEKFVLVAGGPHATVCPDEPFSAGFRFVVRGEGEEILVELADAIDGKRDFSGISGLSVRGPLGPRHGPKRDFLRDLDALASPVDALRLFDPAWYGAKKTVPFAGLLSSRGCPAACTFCCNNVTGRRFRYRSAQGVAQEIARLKVEANLTAFTFFDDSFAVGRRRMEELCTALSDGAPGVHWTCTAHPAHLDRELLKRMKQAGCGGIDIGMESADPGMLLRIGKGVTVERVREVLEEARSLGMHVVVNLMFGWPDETAEELDRTIAFLDEAAPLASSFNARGVVVPYPGTELYEQNHERFAFTEWWIREKPLEYLPFPSSWSVEEVKRAYASDAALERNFFRHPPPIVARIAEALALKARHTFRHVAKASAHPVRVPAAGAR